MLTEKQKIHFKEICIHELVGFTHLLAHQLELDASKIVEEMLAGGFEESKQVFKQYFAEYIDIIE